MPTAITERDRIINMLQLSKLYIEAAELINGCKIQQETISSIRYEPIILNISFACEILLKCYYLFHHHARIKTHDLFEIYNSMSKNNKSQIYNYFKINSAQTINRNDFEILLKLSGDHFYNDRYLYESEYDYDFENSNDINLNNFDKQKYYQWHRYNHVLFLYLLSVNLKTQIAKKILKVKRFNLSNHEKDYIISLLSND